MLLFLYTCSFTIFATPGQQNLEDQNPILLLSKQQHNSDNSFTHTTTSQTRLLHKNIKLKDHLSCSHNIQQGNSLILLLNFLRSNVCRHLTKTVTLANKCICLSHDRISHLPLCQTYSYDFSQAHQPNRHTSSLSLLSQKGPFKILTMFLLPLILFFRSICQST